MHPQDPGSVLKIGSESGGKTGLTEIVKDPEEAEASDFLSSYYINILLRFITDKMPNIFIISQNLLSTPENIILVPDAFFN